jgi:hypothetical protein
LDAALGARDQEDLADGGEATVVDELPAAVVDGGRGRENFGDQERAVDVGAAGLGRGEGDGEIGLVQASSRSGRTMPASPTTRQGGWSCAPTALPRLITMVPCASLGGAIATGAPSISS